MDLDGDGLIGSMRVKDPAGPWKISTCDPRIMLKREPNEFGGDYYFVHPEGLIRNWDGGKVMLAPSSSALDFNRNFPADWQPDWIQTGSGPYPLSEPETQAVANFLMTHRNIHGAQLHHTAAGLILRASARYADERFRCSICVRFRRSARWGSHHRFSLRVSLPQQPVPTRHAVVRSRERLALRPPRHHVLHD